MARLGRGLDYSGKINTVASLQFFGFVVSAPTLTVAGRGRGSPLLSNLITCNFLSHASLIPFPPHPQRHIMATDDLSRFILHRHAMLILLGDRVE